MTRNHYGKGIFGQYPSDCPRRARRASPLGQLAIRYSLSVRYPGTGSQHPLRKFAQPAKVKPGTETNHPPREILPQFLSRPGQHLGHLRRSLPALAQCTILPKSHTGPMHCQQPPSCPHQAESTPFARSRKSKEFWRYHCIAPSERPRSLPNLLAILRHLQAQVIAKVPKWTLTPAAGNL